MSALRGKGQKALGKELLTCGREGGIAIGGAQKVREMPTMIQSEALNGKIYRSEFLN